MSAYFNQFISFLRDIAKSRRVILELSKKDFQSRYLGSYLGIVWAFVNPAVQIAIMWFVFQVGFKSPPVNDFPYILWLIAGIIPWFFFSDGVMGATTSVVDNSFLVKKVVFRVSVLPIVRIISALFIHLFFIAVIFVMFVLYGYTPDIYSAQALYYLFAEVVLILGISWATSSIVIFLKDVGQIVSIFLQFGFWLTPIFWNISMLPDRYRVYVKLNPAYYIIEGYRDCFIHKKLFWDNVWLTAYFWAVTLLIFAVGAVLFRRLRPHFADVL